MTSSGPSRPIRTGQGVRFGVEVVGVGVGVIGGRVPSGQRNSPASVKHGCCTACAGGAATTAAAAPAATAPAASNASTNLRI
ncbi:hypothetical protein GCM10020218_088130 [Dactylosporangium vinaceum]